VNKFQWSKIIEEYKNILNWFQITNQQFF
jgi:hypothetical protein